MRRAEFMLAKQRSLLLLHIKPWPEGTPYPMSAASGFGFCLTGGARSRRLTSLGMGRAEMSHTCLAAEGSKVGSLCLHDSAQGAVTTMTPSLCVKALEPRITSRSLEPVYSSTSLGRSPTSRRVDPVHGARRESSGDSAA